MGTGVRGSPTPAGPGSALERGADVLYRGYRKPKGKHATWQKEIADSRADYVGELGRRSSPWVLVTVGSKKKPASGEAGE
jgi:hypothetical protein